LVFGRLSADQELTAMRASGVSLIALITPIILLSLALSGVCAFVNLDIGPQSRIAYKQLLFKAGVAQAGAMLPEKTFIKDFPGRIIYVGKVNGSELEDILFYQLDEEGKVQFYIRAVQGTLKVDQAKQQVSVWLRDVWRWDKDQRTPVHGGELEITERLTPKAEKRRRITDMTFSELREELREIESRLGRSPEFQKGSREDMERGLKELRRQRGDLTLPIRVQMNRQVSFSFACVGFTLVGIALGIRTHRKETTFGTAIALILVLIYYSFFILGQALETRAEYLPHLILWMPNFLFQAIGAVLLWRLNRGLY
jgi:lipopolysaccharide export system permease protein